jgi:hypothetical protein
MSQNLTNDLPDRFGSSDEDDDDEEVVGWMGEHGEFEARNGGNEDPDEYGEEEQFGRRGPFHNTWDGGFHDDEEEFAFRSLGNGLEPVEERDINVRDFNR